MKNIENEELIIDDNEFFSPEKMVPYSQDEKSPQ